MPPSDLIELALGKVYETFRLPTLFTLVKLDAVTAFIVVLAEAMVMDFFAHAWDLGGFILPAIPVSATQALVGAVAGIGLVRGIQTIKGRVLLHIVVEWGTTPLVAAFLAYAFLPVVLRFT